VKSNQAKRVKLLAALIGGSAMVATGALSVALSEGQDGPVTTVLGSSMTLGGTSTQTTPATTLATSFAKPAITHHSK
jgi:predicted phage tail protein